MKFKSRLPLPDDQLGPGHDADDSRTGETTGVAQAAAPQDKPDGEPLVGAFDAVAQVMRREFDVLKRSIVGLESQLVRRIESERESLGAAVSALRQDVMSRVDELRQSQQKALSELSEQSKASIVSLRGQFEQARQQADSRAVEIKAGLEQILSAKEQKLEKELDALTHNVSGMRVDLEQQMATAGRVSALLNDIAQVFSDPRTLPKGPGPTAPGR
jgi:hypothetical protein